MNELIQKIWSTDGVLVDKNEDGVIDGISLHIDFPDDYFPPALFDFFARIGYETTALSFNFFEQANQRFSLSWVKSDCTRIEMEESRITIHYTTEDELNTVLSTIASEGLAYREDTVVPEIENLEDIWTFAGFGDSFEASPYRELSIGLHMEDRISVELGKAFCEFIARASLLSTQFVLPWRDRQLAKVKITVDEQSDLSLQLVEKNHISFQGTNREIPNIVQTVSRAKHWSEGGNFGYWEKELKRLDFTDDLMLEFDWQDRSEKEKIEEVLNQYKNQIADAKIYISKDPERRNELKEQWKQTYDINQVEVYSSFKTAYHWIEEVVVPQFRGETFDKIIISVVEDNLPKGLELNIRWIQEVYPVDLLLEREWGIQHEKVIFECQPSQESTYIVYGEKSGVRSEMGRLNVPVKRMDYVNGKNYAYPSTSAVAILLKNGERVVELIDSSRASFYEFYLKEVLPAVKEKVKNYEPGQGHVVPFFDRIEIDVWMNESERKLGFDEERISSLEALHEDLYFNTLDYFAHWGEEVEGKPFYAPGGVYPFMHLTIEDEPRAKVKVFRYANDQVPKVRTEKLHFNSSYEMDRVSAVRNGVPVQCLVKSYEIKKEHAHHKVEEFLQRSPYPVVVPDESFRHAQIPVVECYLPTEEEYVSGLKMTLAKPTIIIEAGHHSNEVSSTYAVLQLIDNFIVEQLKKVNIIVIPMANVDGYQLLKRLMSEHPEWKHHAARFNAVGLEYNYVRFSESVFGEGNIMPELLRKWAPDVIIDDHGIPSHEWVQPFAGYNSPPRFPVSYFLPSAKMYGIARVPTNVDGRLLVDNFNAVVDVVSAEIGKTSISKMNNYWRERFKKYGNDWLPEVFLLEEAEHLNFYFDKVEASPKSFQSIGRYPDWIAADIITEAADEIVYDEVLETCVEAQMVFNSAVITQLAQSEIVYTDGMQKFRERPIRLTNYLSG
ncbi:M14 family metallopeptidase [Sporosarcina sp. ACRSL]|uniref:M14 family metallopeptidase n=1 Tax=Sporosarcina sp. ACRSL TaxID=2918215 RepID=UPI001EF60DF4|nr:M14 family metallopeptidase [Sporosarcina sp. ACRSL]